MIPFKMFFEQANFNKNIIIVTGPLGAGKSSYVKKISNINEGIIPTPEFQDGMDVSKNKWWSEAVEEILDDIPKKSKNKIKTLIIETHLRYKNIDSFQGKEIGKISAIDKNIKVHVVLPTKEELIKRQNKRGIDADLDMTESEINWYMSVIKQLKAKRVK